MADNSKQARTDTTTISESRKDSTGERCPLSGKSLVVCSCGQGSEVDHHRFGVRCPFGMPFFCIKQLVFYFVQMEGRMPDRP